LQTWQAEEWEPRIPVPFPPYWLDFPLEQFFSEIPKEVIRIIMPFKWRQFVLLRMTRHCPETLELLQSNPALAWFCADAIAESEVPTPKTREIILAKRRDICAFAGLPATESMVRTLGKIKLDEYTQDLFTNLQELFKDPAKVSRLRFVKRFPVNAVRNLYFHFDYMVWALSTVDKSGDTVWDTMKDKVGTNGCSIWADTMGLGKNLRVPDTEKQLARCKSFEELQHIHDRWAKTFSSEGPTLVKQFFQDHGTYSFPPPSLPGNADIEPITTVTELLEEGSYMQHCAGSYAEKVMNGECYIYRVLWPQRATLEISNTGGMFRICQLKLAHNEEPAVETWKNVRQWLIAAQQASYAA
jgi:hypothetical protein